MKSNDATLKKNQPEQLVDFNGNAVPAAWMMGGKTLTIASGGSFIAESTLMRVCNSGTDVVRLKLKHADYSTVPSRNLGADVGLPVLPGTVIIVGVFQQGQEYSVSGGSIDVTFVFDRRTEMTV